MFRERLLYAPSISYPRPNQCQKQSCIFPLDDKFLVPWSSCEIKLSFHVPHQNLSVAGRTQKVPWWSKPNSAHAAAMAQKVLKTAFAVIHKFNKSVWKYKKNSQFQALSWSGRAKLRRAREKNRVITGEVLVFFQPHWSIPPNSMTRLQEDVRASGAGYMK